MWIIGAVAILGLLTIGCVGSLVRERLQRGLICAPPAAVIVGPLIPEKLKCAAACGSEGVLREGAGYRLGQPSMS